MLLMKEKIFQVNTDWDVKELIFRNYPKILGPHSEIVLRHVWGPGPAMSIGVVWVDPAGTLASYSDISVTKDATIDVHNPKLKTPLRPGEWTVKIMFRSKVGAELKFTILPYSVYEGEKLTFDEVKKYHNGPEGQYFVGDISVFAAKFSVQNAPELLETANKNGRKTDSALEDWIDILSEKIWTIEDTCSVNHFSDTCPPVERCRRTKWSSMSPDPKSEISKNLML